MAKYNFHERGGESHIIVYHCNILQQNENMTQNQTQLSRAIVQTKNRNIPEYTEGLVIGILFQS